MGKIFCVLVLASVGLALARGQTEAAGQALLNAGAEAIRLSMTLGGAMILWCGLMEILRRTGDVARLGRLMRRMLRPLFPGLEDEAAWDAMSLNLAANMLGLGNAATPAGVEAARRLTEPAMGETGLRALAMLLALNNSSLQWLPTTVIALRSAAGAIRPADIWGPTLLSSGAATVAAAMMMALAQRREIRRERLGRLGAAGGAGADRAAGRHRKD